MKAAMKPLAASLLLLVAGGCAIGPDYVRPEVELPKDFAAAQSALPMAERWWGLFGDPALDALVDEALAAPRLQAIA